MKWLLVTIVRGTQPDEPVMSRPRIFDAGEITRNSTGGCQLDGGLGRGGDTEEELWYVTDVVADKYQTAEPTRCRILTDSEADAWCEAAAQLRGDPDIVVTDPGRIQAVATKVAVCNLANSGALPDGLAAPVITQEDLDVLDPDKPAWGVNRRLRTAREIFRVGVAVPSGQASEAIGRPE